MAHPLADCLGRTRGTHEAVARRCAGFQEGNLTLASIHGAGARQGVHRVLVLGEEHVGGAGEADRVAAVEVGGLRELLATHEAGAGRRGVLDVVTLQLFVEDVLQESPVTVRALNALCTPARTDKRQGAALSGLTTYTVRLRARKRPCPAHTLYLPRPRLRAYNVADLSEGLAEAPQRLLSNNSGGA